MSNNYVGKKYLKNGDPDTIFTVNSIDNGFVMFDNGAKCKIETLENSFNEYIDPEIINNNPMNSLSWYLAEQLKGNIPMDRDTSDVHVIQEENVYKPEITPNTMRKVPQEVEHNFEQPVMTNNQHIQPIQRHEVPSTKNDNDNINPEITILKRVKRKNPIKINLVIDELVPDKDKMEVLNEMFHTSMVEFLTDEIMSKIFQNPSKLREQISESLYDYMNSKNTKIKKPRKTKITVEDNENK